MHRITAAALTLILSLSLALSLVACTGTPAPTATDAPESHIGTPIPTILPTRLAPIPTLTAAEQREWQQSRLATVEAGLPTPRPLQVIVYPTPQPLPPTLLPTIAPVLVQRVEVRPVPQSTVPTPIAPPPTLLAFPTHEPPSRVEESLWEMDYEAEHPQALLITPPDVDPPRGPATQMGAHSVSES